MFIAFSLMLSMAVFAAVIVPATAGLRSSPLAYGGIAMATTALLTILILAVAWFAGNRAQDEMSIGYYLLAVAAAIFSVWRAHRLRRLKIRARREGEKLLLYIFAFMALIAVFTMVGIVASVLFETVRFFKIVPFFDFIFGLHWSPQIAIREGQAGATGAFGFIPLLTGTLLISTIAMTVAAPMGFLSAAFMSEFASRKTRNRIKPVLEVLAGIPTIVYGFFALTVLSPFLVELGHSLHVKVAGENALAAGLVMGILLIPFIASLSEDAFHAVPESLRQGALGLGATRLEMTMQVVVPAALPGVVAGLLLAFSRAIGETMIVVMAAGISAKLSVNPLEAVTTVTVQIVTLLVGDQEFDDPKTLAAFALGMVLFVVTLAFNVFALRIVRKYQQRYE